VCDCQAALIKAIIIIIIITSALSLKVATSFLIISRTAAVDQSSVLLVTGHWLQTIQTTIKTLLFLN